MISGSGPGAALLVLAVMPFVYCLPVAFAVAELTAAFPVEGGNYRWSRMAFGDFWGFQAAWWAWMTGVLMCSMFAVLFANYLPWATGVRHWLVCLALIWLMHALNLRGIQAVGRAAVALSVVVLLPFAAMTCLGAAHWRSNPLLPVLAPGKSALSGYGGSVVLAIWLYAGFDKLSAAAEEVEDPPRTFPPALLLAAVMTMASYVVPTAAALAALGDWSSWAGAYFPIAAAKLGGPWLGRAMLFGALCSNALLLNVTMLSVSRVPLALGEDGLLPRWTARRHPRFGTPAASLLLGSGVYSVFSLFDFNQLTIINAWFQMASYILLYVNAWKLRRTHADAPRPFKIPFGEAGLVASLGMTCALSLVAAASAVFKDGRFSAGQAAVGCLALASGPGLYRLRRRWAS